MRARRRMGTGVRALVAYVLAAVTVLPILWLALSALKPGAETFDPGLPSRLTLSNVTFVLTKVPFPRYLFNTALVAVVVTVVALLFHSMAAYALARLRFPGRGLIFSGVVATMLVALPVILVPLFMIVKRLGMIDTYAGLIVPAIFNAYGIFLLRQYYLGIPRELEEAAGIDGCGHLRTYWHVVLPLSRPILAALAVLFFLANWNAFLWPLTITRDPRLRVVQLGIAGLQGEYSTAWNYVLAAALLAAIPTVVVFLAGQRRLVDAMKASGLK
jgi:multiple sugar transport system permease protein